MLAIIVVAAVALGIGWMIRAERMRPKPVDTAEKFLGAMAAGDGSGAAGACSPEIAAGIQDSLRVHKDIWAGKPVLKRSQTYAGVKGTKKGVGRETKAEAEYELQSAAGAPRKMKLVLAGEGAARVTEVWVDGLRILPLVEASPK